MWIGLLHLLNQNSVYEIEYADYYRECGNYYVVLILWFLFIYFFMVGNVNLYFIKLASGMLHWISNFITLNEAEKFIKLNFRMVNLNGNMVNMNKKSYNMWCDKIGIKYFHFYDSEKVLFKM